MPAVKTTLLTQDNLSVYDLDPQAPEIIAVAGPDGFNPDQIDVHSLPEGFRKIGKDEWQKLHDIS